MRKRLTQEEAVIEYIKSHGSITSWEMSERLHILSQGKIISNIRKNPDKYGVTIIQKSKRVRLSYYEAETTICEYSIKEIEENE